MRQIIALKQAVDSSHLSDEGLTMNRDDEAVSPVIATVLLLAITVLLTSMVFVMMSTTLDNVEKADPKASISVRAIIKWLPCSFDN